jgi:hypothetical protein
MKKIIFSLLLISFCSLQAFCDEENFRTLFFEAFSNRDVEAQKSILTKWEKEDAGNAELYAAYFNYYSDLYRAEVFKTQDRNSTKAVELMKNGMDWINKGIEQYPDRLDFRFGKIFMFSETEEFDKFTDEIIKTLEQSSAIDNKWTWANNTVIDKTPKKFMLTAIQEYQIRLYNTEQYDDMKRISETVLKYYPDHIESMSNLSIVFMVQKQYDKAVEVLLKAKKIAPKDIIILSNTAHAYKLNNDSKNAIKYYKQVVKYGNAAEKHQAKQQIEELQKK